jgi:hypothetical protein
MIHSRTSTTLLWLALPFMAVALFSQLFRQTAPIMAQGNGPATAANLADQMIYLPLISVPENPDHTYSNVIVNGSFEAGWIDVGPEQQQPSGWIVSWLQPGELIYDDNSAHATGTPELVHPHLIPPNEQLGGPDAIVLDGENTYKMFHGNHAFGAELRQTVTGLIPGTLMTLTVPVQLHWQPDLDGGDLYAAEAGAWVNGQGQWASMNLLQDRQWYFLTLPSVVVPADGVAEVVIRVKSKWQIGKDFFIDDVRLMAVTP